MNKILFPPIAVMVAVGVSAAAEPPREWIDPDTGHRIIRLSDEPGSASLYFHQNAYSPDGRKIIVTTREGISTIELATRKIEPVVTGEVSVIVVGRKSGDVYYSKRADGKNEIYATNLESKITRKIAELPRGGVSSLNADETLMVGTFAAVDEPRGPRASETGAGASAALANPAGSQPAGREPTATFQEDYRAQRSDGVPTTFAESKELSLHDTLARIHAQPPRSLFTLNMATGELRVIYRQSEWLNHVQFSPTDPNLIMF